MDAKALDQVNTVVVPELRSTLQGLVRRLVLCSIAQRDRGLSHRAIAPIL